MPGNPLFPSNFARLALGPTLRAKYVFAMPFTFLAHIDLLATPLYVRHMPPLHVGHAGRLVADPLLGLRAGTA